MGDVAQPRVEVDLSAWMQREGGTVDLTGALEEPEAGAPEAGADVAWAGVEMAAEPATPGDAALMYTARQQGMARKARTMSAGAQCPAACLNHTRRSLSEAFCAFLAASTAFPCPPELAPAAAPLVMDEQALEAVTRRVVQELSGETLRATVADAVSRAAERVVREEIERLRRTLG